MNSLEVLTKYKYILVVLVLIWAIIVVTTYNVAVDENDKNDFAYNNNVLLVTIIGIVSIFVVSNLVFYLDNFKKSGLTKITEAVNTLILSFRKK
jgi:hypothetical protein